MATKIIKKYQHLLFGERVHAVINETMALPIGNHPCSLQNPCYVIVQSALGNAHDTFDYYATKAEVFAAARQWLAERDLAVPETDGEVYDEAIVRVTEMSLSSNLSSYTDWNLTKRDVQWFAARGFRG